MMSAVRARWTDKGIVCGFAKPWEVGKHTENANIESFNGKLRVECLDQQWFVSIEDARVKLEEGRIDYNRHRPHS